jgi:hypothetical protein
MPVVNVDDLVRLQRKADDIRNVRATPSFQTEQRIKSGFMG